MYYSLKSQRLIFLRASIARRRQPVLHRIGVIMAIIHIVIMFLPGLAFWVFFDVFSGWDFSMASVIPIWAVMLPIYIMEPAQYYLALGIVGTYVSFLAGNIGNLRLPVVISTAEVLGVEPGSPEEGKWSQVWQS